jgi:hypothetical protein
MTRCTSGLLFVSNAVPTLARTLWDNGQHVRIRLKGVSPELGKHRLVPRDANPRADLRALMFEVVVAAVAVLVETGGEESTMHLLRG